MAVALLQVAVAFIQAAVALLQVAVARPSNSKGKKRKEKKQTFMAGSRSTSHYLSNLASTRSTPVLGVLELSLPYLVILVFLVTGLKIIFFWRSSF